MDKILKVLTEGDQKHTDNVNTITRLEQENARLTAEMCNNINTSRSEIAKFIGNNKDFLLLLPKISENIELVIGWLSNGIINDLSQVQLILEILKEIKIHNDKENENNILEKKEENPKGLFNKYIQIIKESIGNDN